MRRFREIEHDIHAAKATGDLEKGARFREELAAWWHWPRERPNDWHVTAERLRSGVVSIIGAPHHLRR
jgi:hypothetical protein